MSFADQRARRMWAAEAYAGWRMPDYPHEADGRNIGRVVMLGRFAGLHLRGTALHLDLDQIIKLKERAQNRKHFN